MSGTVSEAILGHSDLDIVQTFRSLKTQAAKTRCLEDVVRVCGKQTDHIGMHRALVGIARLVEELMNSSHMDKEFPHRIWQRCADGRLLEKPCPAGPPHAATELLTASLKKAAACHLREAVYQRCKHLQSEFRLSEHAVRSILNTSAYASCPVRLDLGMGGVSDIPPYTLERCGNCVNVPARLDGSFPLEAWAQVIPVCSFEFISADCGVRAVYHDIGELRGGDSGLVLHRNAVRFFIEEILGSMSDKELYQTLGGGLQVKTRSRLPLGTGLGTSSLLLCAILKALGSLFNVRLPPSWLFAASVYLENVTGIGGGWEDATAIHPGVKLAESSPKRPLSPRMTLLPVSGEQLHRLEEQLVLVHTGIPRQNPRFFEAVMERYCVNDGRTLQAIERNCCLNKKLAEQLVTGDLPALGEFIGSQWENWKALTEEACTNPMIERLFSAAAPHVYGARMNGAGQGGCAMFLVHEAEKGELLRAVTAALGTTVRCYRWQAVL